MKEYSNPQFTKPNTCDNTSVLNCSSKTDLTNGKGEIRNYYCPKCGKHNYKGIDYTETEWNEWIEIFNED